MQIWSRPKWSQVIASARKGCQTETQVDPSFQLATICESFWPGLNNVSLILQWQSVLPKAKKLSYAHRICISCLARVLKCSHFFSIVKTTMAAKERVTIHFLLGHCFRKNVKNIKCHVFCVVYGRQSNYSDPRAECLWKSACPIVKFTQYQDTHTYHMEDITGLLLHIYRNCLLLQIEPSGWKGSVSYGLGADISLPPCLATGIWNLAPKATSGPKSRGASFGTKLWRNVQRYCVQFLAFMLIKYYGYYLLRKRKFGRLWEFRWHYDTIFKFKCVKINLQKFRSIITHILN